MSRLWLERRALGVFPERTWLYAGKQLLEVVGDECDGATEMGAADALLRQCLPGPWLRPRLDITLSGDAGRVVVLPWRDGLRTASQQMRYAEACLEDAGVTASGGWAMQYGYRRSGYDGIAYALKRTQLEQWKAMASVQRLRLRSVLPVEAAAYWRMSLSRRAGTLLILNEVNRITLMRFTGLGLSAVDVQPCGGQRELALRRLLRRAQASAAAIDVVGCWSTDQSPVTQAVATELYPDAVVRILPHRSWE